MGFLNQISYTTFAYPFLITKISKKLLKKRVRTTLELSANELGEFNSHLKGIKKNGGG
jgi:hypothetical protein